MSVWTLHLAGNKAHMSNMFLNNRQHTMDHHCLPGGSNLLIKRSTVHTGSGLNNHFVMQIQYHEILFKLQIQDVISSASSRPASPDILSKQDDYLHLLQNRMTNVMMKRVLERQIKSNHSLSYTEPGHHEESNQDERKQSENGSCLGRFCK